MIRLTRPLVQHGRELFPTRRDRVIVSGLVALAAFVSFAELLTAQLFSNIILPSGPANENNTVLLGVLFFAALGSLRVVTYFRETYRVGVLERALSRSEGLTPQSQGWRWAAAMELTGLLTMLGRLVVIAMLLIIVSPAFGIVSIISWGLILQIFAGVLERQFVLQRRFRTKQKYGIVVENAQKVGTRIQAAEKASLLAALVLMGLFGILIVFAVDEQIEPGTAFVVFLALRMTGQIFGGVASGLMRFARAIAFSE